MKTKILFLLVFAYALPQILYSQNSIDEVLNLIEKNNTTLEALRKEVEAKKLENKTGIYLPNPEVELGYYRGKPGQIGNRTDISATQSFDIATIMGMKSKLADKLNNSVDWQYESERMNILLDAKLLCLDLIFYNSMKSELETRLEHAAGIADVYEKRLSHGDANRLEYNKAQLNLVNARNELLRLEVDRGSVISELQRMNGGEGITFLFDGYEPVLLPVSFSDWYAQAEQSNPVLAYIKEEVEVSKSHLAVSKAERLPSFFAGYMSEKLVGEHFQGATIGITIPLWENKNRVAQARASILAAEAREVDGKQQFYVRMKNQYERALGLQTVAQDYSKLLDASNNSELLKKALDAGEISLLDYLIELEQIYDSIENALKAEHDFQKAVAELFALEL